MALLMHHRFLADRSPCTVRLRTGRLAGGIQRSGVRLDAVTGGLASAVVDRTCC